MGTKRALREAMAEVDELDIPDGNRVRLSNALSRAFASTDTVGDQEAADVHRIAELHNPELGLSIVRPYTRFRERAGVLLRCFDVRLEQGRMPRVYLPNKHHVFEPLLGRGEHSLYAHCHREFETLVSVVYSLVIDANHTLDGQLEEAALDESGTHTVGSLVYDILKLQALKPFFYEYPSGGHRLIPMGVMVRMWFRQFIRKIFTPPTSAGPVIDRLLASMSKRWGFDTTREAEEAAMAEWRPASSLSDARYLKYALNLSRGVNNVLLGAFEMVDDYATLYHETADAMMTGGVRSPHAPRIVVELVSPNAFRVV